MLSEMIVQVRDAMWGWPLLGSIVVVGVILTCALWFVQFRDFFKSWRVVLGGPDEDPSTGAGSHGDMSPFQAFLNTLSVSMGNGSLAGIATAIAAGGPGAAFWMFFVGFFGMVLRFAEVFLAVSFANTKAGKAVLGGPFLYIQELPMGKVLVTLYAVMALFYGLASGNAMQCNSIVSALTDNFPSMSPMVIGAGLTAFVGYTLLGGAQRIVKVSDKIVPVKVILFFVTIIFVLLYHWANLLPAISLIVKAAFSPQAVAGATAGMAIQQVISLSVSRTINASEAGLGTVGIFYGSTGSEHPENDGLSSMLTVFISNNLVGCMVALALVASGVWNCGENGSAMVSEAYQTALGSFGAYIISFLSIVFGIGVFVSYGYASRQCWLYLTNGKFVHIFTAIFCAVAFIGSVSSVTLVWDAVDIAVGGCLIINMIALLYYIPYMRKELASTDL